MLYAECRRADGTRQLEPAERWLQQHSGDAQLLHALGRLCERQQLWGKAQTYYEASLALDDDWRAHVALGEMLARLGRDEEANAHLAAALKLALSELSAVLERRDAGSPPVAARRDALSDKNVRPASAWTDASPSVALPPPPRT